MSSTQKSPSLVASTNKTYSCAINESRLRESRLPDGQSPRKYTPCTDLDDSQSVNHFKSAQWTADGTSLLTSSADNTLRTFILPPELLSSSSPIALAPWTSHTLPTSINCTAPYPGFSLSDPNTTVFLSAPTELPIRLHNALLPSSAPAATYNLICPTTEAYLTPSSLLWSAPGSTFLAGTSCLISLFDVSRTGEGPVTAMPTIPSKRHKMKGGGVGMRGHVSALSPSPLSSDPLLAAGTWTRWIGLYDAAGMGGTVATWSIASAADTDTGIGGSGVTQTLWSDCGRYLYVVERKSDGVLVFDVRVTGKLVGCLRGRKANTNQRLGVDVYPGEKGMEVWAGGTDGIVRVWEGVGMTEGSQDSSWEWQAHDDPVTSTVVHSSGTVVATSSGQRLLDDLNHHDSDSESESEVSDSESNESGSGSDVEDSDNVPLSPIASSIGSSKTSESRSLSPKKIRTVDNSIRVWGL